MIMGERIAPIPGLPEGAQQKLMGVFDSQPRLQAWQVDLALRHQLPDDLLGHINRVGRCIWRQS